MRSSLIKITGLLNWEVQKALEDSEWRSMSGSSICKKNSDLNMADVFKEFAVNVNVPLMMMLMLIVLRRIYCG